MFTNPLPPTPLLVARRAENARACKIRRRKGIPYPPWAVYRSSDRIRPSSLTVGMRTSCSPSLMPMDRTVLIVPSALCTTGRLVRSVCELPPSMARNARDTLTAVPPARLPCPSLAWPTHQDRTPSHSTSAHLPVSCTPEIICLPPFESARV